MDNENIINNNTPNIINLDQTSNNSTNNNEAITPITETPVSKTKQTDDFVKSLPDWDLIPPYETVRRINRI